MATTRSSVSSLEKAYEALLKRAEKLGFGSVGVADASSRPDLPERLSAALAAGHHADMAWMADTKERRSQPQNLWPEVQSIIMLGTNYGPETDPMADLAQKDCANISVYARQTDYHEVIKGRLKELAGLFANLSGHEVKVFVDTAPVMEKPLAEAAGLGWQGKHTALVSRDFGSWLFLGAIFTTAKLPSDERHAESCGSCTACLDVCPTNAFPAPFKLDARRCLAYYSNEHQGMIPQEFRAPMGNRIFGCDDCLAVCPWNKFAKQSSDLKLAARSELHLPKIETLLKFDETKFKEFFRRTPLRRLGFTRFLRNLLIVAGNSGNKHLPELIFVHLKDKDTSVRASAVWALSKLLAPNEFEILRIKEVGHETDAMVLDEWTSI